MRQEINRGRVAYEPNTLGGGCPMQVGAAAGGYVSFPEALEGTKTRMRGESFFDHYSQARMFFQSQSEPEKQHIIKALRFELGKVETSAIRQRMVGHLAQIDAALPTGVAKGLGIDLLRKSSPPPQNMIVPADGNPKDFQHRTLVDREIVSPLLSMASTVPAPSPRVRSQSWSRGRRYDHRRSGEPQRGRTLD